MPQDQLVLREIHRGEIRFHVMVNPNDAFLQDSWTAYESHEWEPWTFEMIDKHVGPDTVFLDVGAWLGAMSLHVASRVSKVIAFEADPIAYESLTQNIRANPQWTNVTVNNVFVSDRGGTQRVSSLHRGNNSGTTGVLDLGGDSWDVPSIDFARVIKDLPTDVPLFVKMDIEGAEYRVLRSCGALLSKRQNTVLLLSMHPSILMQTVKGRSLFAKCRRRARLVLAHKAIFRQFTGFTRIVGSDKNDVSMRSLSAEILRTGSLSENHRELLFSKD